MRKKGENICLFLGRGKGFEGLWVGHKKPKSTIRARDRFLEYFRKHLTSTGLTSVKIYDRDRVIFITYYKIGHLNNLVLFWSGRDLYFIHNYFDDKVDGFKLVISGKTFDQVDEQLLTDVALLEHLKEYGLNKIDIDDERSHKNIFKEIDQLLEEEESSLVDKKFVKGKVKFLNRKLSNITKDLEKVHVWRFYERLVNSEETDLSNQILLEKSGQKIKFDKTWNEFKKKDAIFKKIKSLKKGEGILNNRKIACEIELNKIKNNQVQTFKKVKMINPIWHSNEKKMQLKGKTSLVQGVVFGKLPSGIEFGVGRNARANDFLRSKWSNKKDIWFHMENYKSAHLIVKTEHFSNLTKLDIQAVGSILSTVSHHQLLEIPLVFTQVKHLRAVKGAAGSVLFRNEKYLVVEYSDIWRKYISLD